MKRAAYLIIPVVALLAACATTDDPKIVEEKSEKDQTQVTGRTTMEKVSGYGTTRQAVQRRN